MKFILGKKQNMTQVFNENGKVIPATVVNAGPVSAVQIKTKEKDGDEAVVFGYGSKKEKRVNKAQRKLGNFAHLKEYRAKNGEAKAELGSVVDSSVFNEGDIVEVSGISKGKGFQGVVKRHGFKGGQRTHGVTKSDYEKADPDNKGITAPEFSFVKLLKEILESQTLNQTTTGEIADQATATAINAAQTNQIEKLGYLLDGIVNGFADMALRRAETIESKYTIKQKETIVDGKKINVYQNFTVSMGGMENSVVFDEEVGGETYDIGAKRDELFTKSFKDKKEGFPTAYYLVNPDSLRNKKYGIDIEMIPERIKDTQLQIMQMREEFGFLRETFGSILNIETLKDEYLQVSGRPSELFMPMDAMKLNEMLANQQGIAPNNTGSFGKPKVKRALQESMR